MNLNKKLTTTIIIILAVLSALFMGGWRKPPATLLVENLIDLDAAIEESIMGVEDTDSQHNESETDEQDETEDDEGEPDTDVTAADTEPEKTVTKIVVEIKGKSIICDKEEYKTVEELIKHIKEITKGTVEVCLKDNYAEAHVYHRVDESLFEFCKESGFEYDAD